MERMEESFFSSSYVLFFRKGCFIHLRRYQGSRVSLFDASIENRVVPGSIT